MIEMILRNIEEKDYFAVECMTKKAFWNLNMPGCDEHYLVHRLWKHPAYIPQLSFLAEYEGKAVGAIIYSKAAIETKCGMVDTLTFGPLCVMPELQKSGIGKRLLLESMKKAKECGHTAILITGVPAYYPKYGFVTADNFHITLPDGSNPDAFMGIELVPDGLKGLEGKFHEADIFMGDVHDKKYLAEVEEFDKAFPYMEKQILPHQWR